jgi:hypothetical protein
MDSLKTVINEVLRDTLYECDVILRSNREENLTLVTDNLRGVCGITVVTVTGPAVKVGPNVERTRLKVKFYMLEPTIKMQITRMALEARKIGGVHSFIPLRVNKVISRIYTDKRKSGKK